MRISEQDYGAILAEMARCGSKGGENMMARFMVFRDSAKEYRWRLRHQNGNIIATSGEGYKTKRGALDAIASVKKNAPDAPILDLTD